MLRLPLEAIRQQLTERSLVHAVDLLPRGHVRIETGLQYPDGSRIDVFAVSDTPLLPLPQGTIRLSDLGQTTGWLLDLNVRPWLSKKRSAFIEDVLRVHGAKQDGASLLLDCRSDELAIGVLRLSQVCLRVADLMFTRRASLQTAFTEDVEELLADSELPYERDVDLHGRNGTPVRVDYLVTGQRRESAILSLSALNPQSAHNAANEIFRRWYDLDLPGQDRQNITVYDDRHSFYRTDDLKRLEDYSAVMPFSEKQGIIELAAAA